MTSLPKKVPSTECYGRGTLPRQLLRIQAIIIGQASMLSLRTATFDRFSHNGDGVFSDAGVGANSHQCDGRRRPVIWGAAEILVGNNLYLLQKL
jgi:hypothetical protein